MTHADKLSKPPPDFHDIGHTESAPHAAAAHNSKPFYSVRFHQLRTLPMGKKSLEFLIYADVDRIGRWFVLITIMTLHMFITGIYWERNYTNQWNLRTQGSCQRSAVNGSLFLLRKKDLVRTVPKNIGGDRRLRWILSRLSGGDWALPYIACSAQTRLLTQ